MRGDAKALGAAEWASTCGDVWAERWEDTDRGLAGLGPYLLSAIVERAPTGAFNAFEIGCGPGSTTLAVSAVCPQALITACDISPSLVEVAKRRAADAPSIRIVLGDAEAMAASEGPFDLLFSRHGVMFFPDPVRAFRALREAVNPGASFVFSCFQSWESNPWASELGSAAAGRTLPTPGQEPGGFAFADPDYVREVLSSGGWIEAQSQSVDFRYAAAEGDDPVEAALSFLLDIGPASRIVQSLPNDERNGAVQRMRQVIEHHFDGRQVAFPAAAWVWRARAPEA
ncbi:MAG: class I SAM-dependent methyltransferase [Sphingomicrobium sp.]